MNKDYVWPACLPQYQNSYLPGKRGIIAGWNQPFPTDFYHPDTTFGEYEEGNLREREALYEAVKCSDPSWMESDTYYPSGTVCYADVAFASSVQFGISGSGIVRPFISENQKIPRYSWAGSLSFSKGADYPITGFSIERLLSSSNPTVFTDAQCYMDWIAAQYDYILPEGYIIPSSCSQSSGSKHTTKKNSCRSRPFYQNMARPLNVTSMTEYQNAL
jgi:hypothetical protein